MASRSEREWKDRSPWSRMLLALLPFPILGLFMGGIYLLPVVWLTKGRDPWLTILLSAALACTILGAGFAAGLPLWSLIPIWIVCIALLLGVRSFFGGLDRNVERFGFVHMAAVISLLWIPFFTRPETVANGPEGAVPSASGVMDAHEVPGEGSEEPPPSVAADT